LDIVFLPHWYRKQEYPLVHTTASPASVDTRIATWVYTALLTGVNRERYGCGRSEEEWTEQKPRTGDACSATG
jgi:hypothetical protein